MERACPVWPREMIEARLITRRNALWQACERLSNKRLARRQYNHHVLAMGVAYDWKKETIRNKLKKPSHEDFERELQYEGELVMIRAALASVASPETFKRAIQGNKNEGCRPMYEEEIKPYRRGLEYSYRVFQLWLEPFLEDVGEALPKRVVGKKREETPFEVVIIPGSVPDEPEFTAEAYKKALGATKGRNSTRRSAGASIFIE